LSLTKRCVFRIDKEAGEDREKASQRCHIRGRRHTVSLPVVTNAGMKKPIRDTGDDSDKKQRKKQQYPDWKIC
jgi:hypothetical protein